MSEGNVLLATLLETLADFALLAGWTADETQDALRRAQAGSGERLGIQRKELAERLGVNRRALSAWDHFPLVKDESRRLDVLLRLQRCDEPEVEAHEVGAYIRAAREVVRAGLVTRNKLLTPAALSLLTRAHSRLTAVVGALRSEAESTRAQLALGSRVANTKQVDPAARLQPGQAQTTRSSPDLQKIQPTSSSSQLFPPVTL